jgi:hypothetical protein
MRGGTVVESRPWVVALLTVSPIVVSSNGRAVRWNYARMFGFVCAGATLAIAQNRAASGASAATDDPMGLALMLAGLLFVVSAAVRMAELRYWHGFFVVDRKQESARSRFAVLTISVLGGVVSFLIQGALPALVIGAIAWLEG